MTPAPRVCPWFGYAPLDPAQVARTDGIVFVKDSRRARLLSVQRPLPAPPADHHERY
jgi:hypothetical protein